MTLTAEEAAYMTPLRKALPSPHIIMNEYFMPEAKRRGIVLHWQQGDAYAVLGTIARQLGYSTYAEGMVDLLRKEEQQKQLVTHKEGDLGDIKQTETEPPPVDPVPKVRYGLIVSCILIAATVIILIWRAIYSLMEQGT